MHENGELDSLNDFDTLSTRSTLSFDNSEKKKKEQANNVKQINQSQGKIMKEKQHGEPECNP